MKIISINGQGRTGKTTIAKVLLEKFENSAYISGDALVAVRPFGVNEKTDRLVIKNSISFINNLSEKTDFLFVWLRASKEVRHKRRAERSRDGADNPSEFDFIDKIIPDVESFNLIRGEYLEINTSDKTPEDVAEIIKKAA